jgi:hypothetical protein
VPAAPLFAEVADRLREVAAAVDIHGVNVDRAQKRMLSAGDPTMSEAEEPREQNSRRRRTRDRHLTDAGKTHA